MILFTALAGLLFGLARGGRLSNLSRRRFFFWPLIILAALCEILSRYLNLPLLLALVRYAAAIIFLLANWRRPGIITILAGTFMNGLVIIANRGRMPLVFAQPPDDAMVEKIMAAPNYILAEGHEHLLFLADRIKVFSYMLSIGDFFIAAGVFILVAHLVSRRRVRPGKSRAETSRQG